MTNNINKVNPILKKDPHFQLPNAAAAASNVGGGSGGGQGEPPLLSSTATTSGNKPETPEKAKKHLKWDEHAIEEHDLLRGTRMKVGHEVILLWSMFQSTLLA
jgi:hypothetical protein